MEQDIVLTMRGICKSFPGVKALNDVDFTLRKGTIHALMGENGAGKSTLMSVLFGLYQPEEGEIRKNIINADLVECIIAMPTQLFYTTQIPVSLWFLNKQKKQPGKTLFIDARKLGTMVSRKLRELTDDDIRKIADIYKDFIDGTLEDVKGYCAAVTIEEIEKQDYILTPGRYVGIEEQEDDGEPFEEKMARLTSELAMMFEKSHELEAEIRKKLGAIGYEI